MDIETNLEIFSKLVFGLNVLVGRRDPSVSCEEIFRIRESMRRLNETLEAYDEMSEEVAAEKKNEIIDVFPLDNVLEEIPLVRQDEDAMLFCEVVKKNKRKPSQARKKSGEVEVAKNLWMRMNFRPEATRMFFYNGDRICCQLTDNVLALVQLGKVVETMKDEKTRTILCRYGTRERCGKINCEFAHRGEKLVKVGSYHRCPKVRTFGNETSLSKDFEKVTMRDVKLILFYGLTDVLASVLWLEKYCREKTVIDVNVA
jgi:hypothetical protein